MYCKWAGKRLCGKIGGGANAYLEHSDASKSQWFAACTSTAGSLFPYGNSYIGGFCHTPGDGGASSVDVKSRPSCTGTVAPYNSIFDMSGNASEWEDSCGNISGTWFCHSRGGNFTDASEGAVQCKDESVWPVDLSAKWLGFRCCAD